MLQIIFRNFKKITTVGTTNLISQEAIDKLKEMVNNIDFAMMQTNLNVNPSHSIPMSTKEVDGDGNIWFLSNKNSEHNKHIKADGVSQLIYSKPSDMEFLTVYGEATISTDRADIDRLYGKMDDAWFDGKNDPNITAIRIAPTDCHYWDTKGGKLITLFKIGLGIVTGEKQDLGVRGDLDI